MLIKFGIASYLPIGLNLLRAVADLAQLARKFDKAGRQAGVEDVPYPKRGSLTAHLSRSAYLRNLVPTACS